MNLRLDQCSIRVRVSRDEALELLERGKLAEIFPFGEQSLELRVEAKFETSESKNALEVHFLGSEIRMLAAETELRRLVLNGEKRTPKQSLELSRKIFMNDKTIDLRFEIDRFNPDQRRRLENEQREGEK